MAQGILRQLVAGEEIEVASAGVAARNGMSASPEAIEVCCEAGIDISAHLTSSLTTEIIAGADLLLAMEVHHRDAARRARPAGAAKILLLSEFAGATDPGGVSDPFGAGVAQYRRTFEEIRALLEPALPLLRAMAAQGR